MTKRLAILLGSLAALLLGGTAGAESTAPAAGASARAFAVRIVVPGQSGAATREVVAPPDTVQFGASFAYPQDGSVLTTGAVTASASAAAPDTTATASASSEVTTLSFFGGEVTVAQVAGRAAAKAAPGEATGDLSGARVSGLTVAGTPVEPQPGLKVPLGDWGYALVLARGEAPAEDGYRGFVTGLVVHLNVDHGGLPAGSEIQVGYAEASVTAPEPPPPPPATTAPTTTARPSAGKPRPSSEDPAHAPPAQRKPPVRRPAPPVDAQLTRAGYVFPVHGPASFTDTFGAGRAVVGWHHGEDIFAPIGAPVLAVAKGTLFSVGWNEVGGNRLWLRDARGNEFYYAHLSAFTPLAVNGAQVEPGDVIGFVGNTGDAQTTPPHLHFEIHPVGLLSLGYDGVVSAYPYLSAWRRLEDVRFIPGAGWAPRLLQASTAPSPGAFLLSSTDISSVSGLRPGSLRSALAAQEASAEQPGPPAADAGGPSGAPTGG